MIEQNPGEDPPDLDIVIMCLDGGDGVETKVLIKAEVALR
jgi:hypothetical protein